MLCRSPVPLDGRKFSFGDAIPNRFPRFVPCGTCKSCRINRSRVWATRMYLESTLQEDNCFVTLTYAPEFLPEGANLEPDHLTKFLKRLRYRVGSFRYFACGEYGGKFGRPHYHLIIFGLGAQHEPAIERSWSDASGTLFGNIKLGTCTLQSINYVSNYMLKDFVDPPGRFRSFLRMSKGSKESPGGLGFGAVKRLARRFYSFRSVPYVIQLAGRILPLGRYLREKLMEILNLYPPELRYSYFFSVLRSITIRNGYWYLDKYAERFSP